MVSKFSHCTWFYYTVKCNIGWLLKIMCHLKRPCCVHLERSEGFLRLGPLIRNHWYVNEGAYYGKILVGDAPLMTVWVLYSDASEESHTGSAVHTENTSLTPRYYVKNYSSGCYSSWMQGIENTCILERQRRSTRSGLVHTRTEKVKRALLREKIALLRRGYSGKILRRADALLG
jgi:hypothetical protein